MAKKDEKGGDKKKKLIFCLGLEIRTSPVEIPAVLGKWWDRLIFNMMIWAESLAWVYNLIKETDGRPPWLEEGEGEKERAWKVASLDSFFHCANQYAWYKRCRDAVIQELRDLEDPEEEIMKFKIEDFPVLAEYAVRERWDLARTTSSNQTFVKEHPGQKFHPFHPKNKSLYRESYLN